MVASLAQAETIAVLGDAERRLLTVNGAADRARPRSDRLRRWRAPWRRTTRTSG